MTSPVDTVPPYHISCHKCHGMSQSSTYCIRVKPFQSQPFLPLPSRRTSRAMSARYTTHHHVLQTQDAQHNRSHRPASQTTFTRRKGRLTSKSSNVRVIASSKTTPATTPVSALSRTPINAQNLPQIPSSSPPPSIAEGFSDGLMSDSAHLWDPPSETGTDLNIEASENLQEFPLTQVAKRVRVCVLI